MSPYPVSREGWPAIFLNPAEFAAADKAGRKVVINALMFCVLIATMYACGGQQ